VHKTWSTPTSWSCSRNRHLPSSLTGALPRHRQDALFVSLVTAPSRVLFSVTSHSSHHPGCVGSPRASSDLAVDHCCCAAAVHGEPCPFPPPRSLGASLCLKPCRVGAPQAEEAGGVDLFAIRPLFVRHQPRRRLGRMATRPGQCDTLVSL
jgi:hypothetical protein